MAVREFVERLRKFMSGLESDYGELSDFYRALRKCDAETW